MSTSNVDTADLAALLNEEAFRPFAVLGQAHCSGARPHGNCPDKVQQKILETASKEAALKPSRPERHSCMECAVGSTAGLSSASA